MLIERLLETPARVLIEGDDDTRSLSQQSDAAWQTQGIELHLQRNDSRLDVFLLASDTPVKRIMLRWSLPVASGWRFLGDQWERGYGDLEWRGIVPERILPWYVLAYNGRVTEGFGVKTGGAALAYWQVDSGGISLVLDVRCGNQGVSLGERRLHVATVVGYASREGLSPFAGAQAFCAQLCPTPRLPSHTVYGSNDWYYRYGRSTHQSILEDGQITAELATDAENRPYVVIDGGWQVGQTHDGDIDGGDRTRGNSRFPDMPGLAAALKAQHVRPGIWVRPLVAPAATAADLLLTPAEGGVYSHLPILDPSLPENLATVAEDIRRLQSWGYELIKHDFTTVDILGRWGFDMHTDITSGPWTFGDRSRTTAEIIRTLYETIRTAAGDAVLIGCNTIGHLGAGLFELQRTGDDTSGREWDRTRKMGVNTLAFRMPQHGTFFLADADCVGLTNAIPWTLNRQWLTLLARSGTPLFVSADPNALGEEQKRALKESYALAARPQPNAVPEDWLDTICPTRWTCGDETLSFDWFALV